MAIPIRSNPFSQSKRQNSRTILIFERFAKILINFLKQLFPVFFKNPEIVPDMTGGAVLGLRLKSNKSGPEAYQDLLDWEERKLFINAPAAGTNIFLTKEYAHIKYGERASWGPEGLTLKRPDNPDTSNSGKFYRG